jgi:ABC-type phosphate/phosphonate transport system ATPase subunit
MKDAFLSAIVSTQEQRINIAKALIQDRKPLRTVHEISRLEFSKIKNLSFNRLDGHFEV